MPSRSRRGSARLTVRRVEEFVSDPIANRATPTLPDKLVVAHVALTREIGTHHCSVLLALDSETRRAPEKSWLSSKPLNLC